MNKEKEMLDKIKDFLGAKEVFLNVRRTTIERLQNCCNKLESKNNTGKFAKVDETGDLISAGGNIGSVFTLGITKAGGEIIKAANNSARRKFSAKSSEAFQQHLKNDESVLYCYDKAHASLIDCIRENKELEIISAIIKFLKLEVKPENKETKLFNTDYKIYNVTTNIWKEKTNLNSGEMKRTIELLNENLKELESDLKREQKWFIELKNQSNGSEKNNFISIGNISWWWILGVILIVFVIWLFSKAIGWVKKS